MKMDLIQPFINVADAVLSQGLSGTTKVGHLAMEEDGYRRKGVAGMVALSGDIEGRIIHRLRIRGTSRILLQSTVWQIQSAIPAVFQALEVDLPAGRSYSVAWHKYAPVKPVEVAPNHFPLGDKRHARPRPARG